MTQTSDITNLLQEALNKDQGAATAPSTPSLKIYFYNKNNFIINKKIYFMLKFKQILQLCNTLKRLSNVEFKYFF